MASDFIEMLDTWHSFPEVWDNKLDANYLQQQLDSLKRNKSEMFNRMRAYPYFSPSSANSCPRELYMKVKKAKKDEQKKQPHQSRWQKAGTLFGDMIQRELLFIEKHYEKLTGEAPAFVPEYTADGYPAWEDFVQKVHTVDRLDQTFSLFGKPDGILRYNGQRVGLEIKSKQTTSAQTSLYSMKEAKEDHIRQCVAYSIMYGVDDFIILYGNLSKKGWVYSEEDYRKNPDIRAFNVHVTEGDRSNLLDYFASIVKSAEKNNPPKLDLDKWTFNNYKTVISETLTEDEVLDIENQVNRYKKSRLPDWKKKQYVNALQFIKEVRGDEF